MPQLDMLDSEVPILPKKAKDDLITLLEDNLNEFIPPNNNKKLIIQGWQSLCQKYSPVFLEKSPHHLCQWSALKLIQDCIKESGDIDFLLIGLIRNPLDTLYSQFKRWKTRPEQLEQQWLVAYKNLLKLKEQMGDQLIIVRYEDMVFSIESLESVFNFCKVSVNDTYKNFFHQHSLLKWKFDKYFGFALSNETIELAVKYGYQQDDITNQTNLLWPIIREFSRAEYKLKKIPKKILRKIY